jgi:hypothetical protein
MAAYLHDTGLVMDQRSVVSGLLMKRNHVIYGFMFIVGRCIPCTGIMYCNTVVYKRFVVV